MTRAFAGALVALAVLMPACGGRSSTGIPWRRDGGAWYDGPPSHKDALPWSKDRGLPIKLDRGPTKKDYLAPPDLGCLPIPAGQAMGAYKGSWKGTLSCPGMSQQTMSGTLGLTLSKIAGASAFSVQGNLEGQLDLGLPVAGSFSGTMVCTALTANLPSVVIGSGAIVYKLQGGLGATFGKTGAGSGWGFSGGTIDIKDPNLGCVASGGWFAYH